LKFEEERQAHEAKMAKMEAEMRQVFNQKVAEKEAKLKQGEDEVCIVVVMWSWFPANSK
jgi:septin 7